MKFIELKKHLQSQLDNSYLIEGDDRFVVNNALSQIEKKANLNMPDVNRVVIEADKNFADELLFLLESFPFGDEKKLVIVKEPEQKDAFKKLEPVLKNLPDYILLIFVSYGENTLTKNLKKYTNFIDCSKLDTKTISAWIVGQVKKAGKEIEEGALNNLMLYTNMNMARIETEVNKLASMVEPVVSVDMVNKFVSRDKEYQIYELADFLSKKDSVKVYDLIETMTKGSAGGVGLVQYLYSAFRKFLLISLSNENDEELASVFKVKPYAIKMSRLQAGKFTPKQLKHIVDELSKLEYDLKNGHANQENAIHIAVAKILLSI